MPYLERGKAGDAERIFEHDIVAGIGQNEIQPILLHVVEHALEGQRHDTEAVIRDALAEVARGRGPAIYRILLAAEREHTDRHIRLRARESGQKKARDQA